MYIFEKLQTLYDNGARGPRSFRPFSYIVNRRPKWKPLLSCTCKLCKPQTAGLVEILFSFRTFWDRLCAYLRYCFCTYRIFRLLITDYTRGRKKIMKITQRLRRHIRYVNPGSTKFNGNFSSVWYRFLIFQ